MKKYTDIIDLFYTCDDPAKEILVTHSMQVLKKALEIAEKNPGVNIDIITAGAILHDIGIRCCNAPDIGCFGKKHYLQHGTAGAEMLRQKFGDKFEFAARICERHTGTGITALEIRENHLPLPEKDLIPETTEEKIVCLADKFFSKSKDMKEKSLEDIRKNMKKFGSRNLERFEKMLEELQYG